MDYQPGQNETNKIQMSKLTIAGFGFLFVLLIGVASYLVFITSNLVKEKNRISQKLEAEQSEPKLETSLPHADSVEQTETEIKEESTPETIESEGAVSRLLTVDWFDQPVLVQEKSPEERLYIVGKVASGQYSGKEVYLHYEIGMGAWPVHYINLDNGERLEFGEDKSVGLKGVHDLAEKIMFPGSNVELIKGYANRMQQDTKKLRKVFTHRVLGDFYLNENGCFVTQLPDHTEIAYTMKVPFISKERNQMDIFFDDGSKNKEEYDYEVTQGCAGQCRKLRVREESGLESRLKPTAKSPGGDIIWELKDNNDPLLKELYNDKNTVAYLNNNGQNKYSYEEFISYHPILYWKDPLGRWIEFRNTRFIIAAEMCKPVIYLYPKKDTRVQIKVEPNGGFTFTDPQYNQGWDVLAYSNGKIKNLADNKNYPYLFWEGIGLDYPKIEKGWIVQDNELETFLEEKLQLLGLNKKEIRDFNDYWIKRLKEDAYPLHKIAFLDKSTFDELAPLEIKGENPDKIIRVFMTAQGVEKYEKIEPQKLPQTPSRKGFTVVEWGGALLK
ncbi:MAG: hypothetical protein GF347_01480 [Candidatus Moranbacteria bacterium]|nr:hypothetical protein [Candidatus Moranbacteria bacterium]